MDAKKTLLQAVDLTVTRPGRAGNRKVLDSIDLTIAPRQIVQLQGPSGAGKSTLLWALARMLPLDGGALFLDGRPSDEWAAPAWRTVVALVVQTHSMVPGTVAQNLLLPWTLRIRCRQEGGAGNGAPSVRPGCRFRPDESVLRRELDGIGLEEVSLESDASRLSVGQTARVSLLRSLLTEPRCLLLDEPCAALDRETADRTLDRVSRFVDADRAALIVGHGPIEHTSRTVRLEEVWLEAGRLEAGRLSEEKP